MVEEAEPKRPPPPSFTWANITTTSKIEISSCTTFIKSFMG
jgi:hypothetical protein